MIIGQYAFALQIDTQVSGIAGLGVLERKGDDRIYPEGLPDVEKPNGDLSDDAKRDYAEAASILSRSPRGACALLRLCLMKLMQQLNLTGELNEDIKRLVSGGLDPAIQQSCDAVRVIGNNSVHPGVIDIRDDNDTAESLFALINFIADQMITQPAKRAKFYSSKVPDADKTKIAKRDSK